MPPFRYAEHSGIPLSTALHMTVANSGMSRFNVMVGGTAITAKFPLDNLFRLEDRVNGDRAEVSVQINPNKITFSDNSGVSSWLPITTQFKDIHVSEGATVRWDTKEVLTRFRLSSNLLDDGTSKPNLLLEAIVLPSGTWNAVPIPEQLTLSNTASAAIRLWSEDCTWISPLPINKLPTVAGIARQTFDVTLPNEFSYRWYIQAILRRLDEGRSIADRISFNAYMENPFLTKPTTPATCWLPDPYYHIVGNSSSGMLQNKQGCIKMFERNGRLVHRLKPSAPPKFNPLAKGFNLSPSCLPTDSPPHLRVLAGKLFNASIASSTAKNYSTVASHIAALEKDLGRKFSWPLNAEDSNLLLLALIGKGIRPSTVKQYLSGTRRLSLAQGVMSPPPQTEIAKTLIKGYENLCRDPVKAVASDNHRPVSIPFLRLLGHSASKHWKGDQFDLSSFWVTGLVAFWGSLRIGEILCEKPESFSPASDLLASDVLNMSDSSFALWIRDPKVPKKYGDVVEIWKTPQFADLDPFQAFMAYLDQRNSKGFTSSQPLFMRSNGKTFTHSIFSTALQSLISHYSLELGLSTNRWTGHSFRSGLPTLLQSAGFSEEQIKAWGRWSSTAYKLYTKDINRRFEVQRSILQVMDKLKTFTEPHP